MTIPTNEALCERVQNGDPEALGNLLKENGGLIWKIANQFTQLEPEDRYQAGAEGMIKAAYSYDVNHGVPFTNYAANRIRWAIIKEIQRCSAIHLPERPERLARQIREAEVELEEKAGKKPTDEEICNALGITPDDLQTGRSITILSRPTSIHNQIDEDGNTIEDTIGDSVNEIEAAEDQIYHKQESDFIRQKLKEILTDREYQIIEYRYLSSDHTRTLQETGDRFGLTYSQTNDTAERSREKVRRKKHIFTSWLTPERAYSLGMKGSSYSAWKHSGTSSTERAVLKAEERRSMDW